MKKAVVGVALLCVVTACSETAQEVTSSDDSASPSSSEGIQIVVPSDPGAQYYLAGRDQMSNGNLQVLTRRVGPSGESFARREIDCEAGTVRYLGEGDSLDEARQNSPNLGILSAPVAESITGVITQFSCAG